MTTTTRTALPALPEARTSRTNRTRSGDGVTFARVVVAEWAKFTSLRSTTWTLVATVVAMVGVSVLAAWGTTIDAVDAGTGPMNLAQFLGAGYQLGQLSVAVLGVLTITGEYSTGMIRSTFAAVPRRVPVLGAKALVLAGVVALTSLVSLALSYLATMPFHDALGARLDLGDPETLRLTLGVPLYLVAISLLAFGVGVLVRHSAGALTAVIALLLVVENVLMLIPLRVIELISPFLPSTAGRRLLFDQETLTAVDAATSGAHLTPWQGYGVLLAWVAGLLVLGAWLLRRRDA
ncbi:ABC transporter permease [Actinotalea sp. M2MS4P-6]|uniref:ABC transporter permease n=1 Tax=Actinotalea sp. M2MS4P-6 TaxID=2983762 RepID=UPI0021E4E373|nr:ABC transporter permease [Actinotalea sp. M2MS4P-6]MCV2396516.1 ABC transporter permease [Actinotalea sp. M2MS4P-6]